MASSVIPRYITPLCYVWSETEASTVVANDNYIVAQVITTGSVRRFHFQKVALMVCRTSRFAIGFSRERYIVLLRKKKYKS